MVNVVPLIVETAVFHKHLACLIWGCALGAGERVLKAKKCYFFSFFKELDLL